MGSFSVVAALATLAYDGRRSTFFRKELLNALRILDQGHITPEAMVGSWAGAMGQSQFMPSSFLAYAVDWDGDGRRDIWGTRADVFASIANYLARSGWKGDAGWGAEVRLPSSFDARLAGLEVKKPIAFWQDVGVRQPDGRGFSGSSGEASLVLPGGSDGPALLVTENYRAILRWNNSVYFASAVGYLADSLDAR
jgi:membrane-bound lytic murein transglycosylase B